MVASIRSISKVKRQRRRTAQTCYDGLEEVFEKASRHIKNGLIQRIPICRSPKLLNNKVSNRNIAQRRLSENSKETVDSDPASLSKDLRYISNQEYAPTLDCVVNPIQYELRQMGHSLTEMLRSTSSERLHPCFKKSACSEMNASPPKRITNREPGSLSFCNNEKAELSSRTSGDSSLGASFPQSSIGSYCDWEGTESSITSIVECDFDSEHFSENTL